MSGDLRCEVEGCGQRGYTVSGRDGRILCADCWGYLEDRSVRPGSGFGPWVRRIFRRR